MRYAYAWLRLDNGLNDIVPQSFIELSSANLLYAPLRYDLRIKWFTKDRSELSKIDCIKFDEYYIFCHYLAA